MSLGGFAFEAVGFSFTELKRQVNTHWAEIEVANRIEALQWIGPKSDDITIQGVLFPEEFGGLDTLQDLIAQAKAGVPMMLVTRAGKIHGLHVVISIDEDRKHIKADGTPRHDAYHIKLKRYVPGAAGGLWT
jgi:uncharacterized protein